MPFGKVPKIMQTINFQKFVNSIFTYVYTSYLTLEARKFE